MMVNKVNPTRVNRTLYVGVGGQGQIALAAVKRRLLAAYGDVPPMVRFMALDTAQPDDPGVWGASREFIRLSFPGAAQYVDDKHESLSVWFDHEDIPRVAGAAQIPQLGRLLLLFNMRSVLELVTDNVKKLFSESLDPDGRWECAPATPQVVFFGSIAGGTGSGTLLDLACAMRTVTQARGGDTPVDWTHKAVLVTPHVFTPLPNTHYVNQNGYAFLSQLDFLMAEREAILEGKHKHLFHVSSPDGVEYDMVRPFDSVTLVGDMTQGEISAVNYEEPKDLARAVSEVMYALLADMAVVKKNDSGGKDASEGDVVAGDSIGRALEGALANLPNFEQPWESGKRCWYGGVGISVLRFPRQAFADYAATVYAKQLVETLHAGGKAEEGGHRDRSAQAFLTKHGLEELGEDANQIIDEILDPREKLRVEVPKSLEKAEQVEAEWQRVETALETALDQRRRTADAKQSALLEKTMQHLEGFLDDVVRTEGSERAASCINELLGYFESVEKEMVAEAERAANDAVRRQEGMAAHKDSARKALKSPFGKKKKVEKALGDYAATLPAFARAKVQEIRCARAAKLCVSLGSALQQQRAALGQRRSAIDELQRRAADEVHNAELALERAAGDPAVIGVYPDPQELTLPTPNPADFYDWCREQTGEPVTNAWTKPVDEGWKRLLAYARDRVSVASLGEVSLVSTLNNASEERRDHWLGRADQRCQPLLPVARGRLEGMTAEDAPTTHYYVARHPGIRDAYEKPTLEDRPRWNGETVTELDSGDEDCAQFFRYWGCVPAYVLGEFSTMRDKYLQHVRRDGMWCLLLDKRWKEVVSDLKPAEEGEREQTLGDLERRQAGSG